MWISGLYSGILGTSLLGEDDVGSGSGFERYGNSILVKIPRPRDGLSIAPGGGRGVRVSVLRGDVR